MSPSPIAERLTAQALAGPPLTRAVDVAERLLAVQGQDPRGARLAIRARTEGLIASDVDRRALSEDRTLLITWRNRGTLHLVRSDDYPFLQALTTPTLLTANNRRLRQEGVSEAAAERAMGTIERALAAEGPLSGKDLKQRLQPVAPVAGQAFIHLMFLAALRGLVVRGPMVGKQHAYALVRDWLGPQPEIDRDAAMAELARRYLAGHAPADDRDLARGAGLPLRDARAGLGAIASELVEREDGLLELKRQPPPAEIPPPRLLGAYDPLLLGWTSREEVVGPHRMLVTNNGLFRPFALVEGRAVATWSFTAGKAAIKHLEAVPKKAVAALEADARAVEDFLNTP